MHGGPSRAGTSAAATAAGTMAWCGLAALLAFGALGAWLAGLSPTALDWQPALAAAAPWRTWSAVFVHYSLLHLAANLAGLLVVAALGAAAQVPPRLALAWALAWPLTQVGLAVEPALAHYGGLSGVLHAGVAIVALQLLLEPGGGRARRSIGFGLGSGLAVKLWLEAPWAGAVAHPPGWDIATAPIAHVSGTLAGLLAAALLLPFAARPRHDRFPPSTTS